MYWGGDCIRKRLRSFVRSRGFPNRPRFKSGRYISSATITNAIAVHSRGSMANGRKVRRCSPWAGPCEFKKAGVNAVDLLGTTFRLTSGAAASINPEAINILSVHVAQCIFTGSKVRGGDAVGRCAVPRKRNRDLTGI